MKEAVPIILPDLGSSDALSDFAARLNERVSANKLTREEAAAFYAQARQTEYHLNYLLKDFGERFTAAYPKQSAAQTIALYRCLAEEDLTELKRILREQWGVFFATSPEKNPYLSAQEDVYLRTYIIPFIRNCLLSLDYLRDHYLELFQGYFANPNTRLARVTEGLLAMWTETGSESFLGEFKFSAVEAKLILKKPKNFNSIALEQTLTAALSLSPTDFEKLQKSLSAQHELLAYKNLVNAYLFNAAVMQWVNSTDKEKSFAEAMEYFGRLIVAALRDKKSNAWQCLMASLNLIFNTINALPASKPEELAKKQLAQKEFVLYDKMGHPLINILLQKISSMANICALKKDSTGFSSYQSLLKKLRQVKFGFLRALRGASTIDYSTKPQLQSFDSAVAEIKSPVMPDAFTQPLAQLSLLQCKKPGSFSVQLLTSSPREFQGFINSLGDKARVPAIQNIINTYCFCRHAMGFVTAVNEADKKNHHEQCLFYFRNLLFTPLRDKVDHDWSYLTDALSLITQTINAWSEEHKPSAIEKFLGRPVAPAIPREAAAGPGAAEISPVALENTSLFNEFFSILDQTSKLYSTDSAAQDSNFKKLKNRLQDVKEELTAIVYPPKLPGRASENAIHIHKICLAPDIATATLDLPTAAAVTVVKREIINDSTVKQLAPLVRAAQLSPTEAKEWQKIYYQTAYELSQNTLRQLRIAMGASGWLVLPLLVLLPLYLYTLATRYVFRVSKTEFHTEKTKRGVSGKEAAADKSPIFNSQGELRKLEATKEGETAYVYMTRQQHERYQLKNQKANLDSQGLFKSSSKREKIDARLTDSKRTSARVVTRR